MGLEYARQLAASGYSLLLVSNQEEALEKAREQIESQYGVTVHVRCQDLAAPDAADELLACCREVNLMPDMLVCNAGMFFFSELTPEVDKSVVTMIGLHVLTVTRMCILFGDWMKRKGAGNIIIMSSMASRLPTPGIAVYSATKAYLRSFGKSLWFEMKPYGVTVTTICPAAVATPLYRLKPELMDLGVKLGVINTPGWLVRRALKAARRGRRVVSPAFMNVYLPPLVALLPAGIENRIWKRIK